MQNKFFEILFFLFFVKIVGGDEKITAAGGFLI